MQNKIFSTMVIAVVVIFAVNRVDAQNDSTETKIKEKIVTNDTMNMKKCMDIIASDESMRNEMIIKLTANIEKTETIPLNPQKRHENFYIKNKIVPRKENINVSVSDSTNNTLKLRNKRAKE